MEGIDMACKQKVYCKSFTSDISLPIPFLFPLFERKSLNFLAVSIKKCIFAADYRI